MTVFSGLGMHATTYASTLTLRFMLVGRVLRQGQNGALTSLRSWSGATHSHAAVASLISTCETAAYRDEVCSHAVLSAWSQSLTKRSAYHPNVSRAMLVKHDSLLIAQRRSYCSDASLPGSALLRTFLHDTLYHPKDGYFAKEPPVGSLACPLDFPAMRGQRGVCAVTKLVRPSSRNLYTLCSFPAFVSHADYLAALSQRYKELKMAWLTPAEIFSPVYGAAVATFICEQHRPHTHGEGLNIMEVGGGTGTLAVDILARCYSALSFVIAISA